MSTAYHPQTDGQSERLIQILEDMLRSCVLDLGGSWDTHLGMAEFVYNNSYQSSAGMAPFQALYGRACLSPLCWAEAGERWDPALFRRLQRLWWRSGENLFRRLMTLFLQCGGTFRRLRVVRRSTPIFGDMTWSSRLVTSSSCG